MSKDKYELQRKFENSFCVLVVQWLFLWYFRITHGWFYSSFFTLCMSVPYSKTLSNLLSNPSSPSYLFFTLLFWPPCSQKTFPPLLFSTGVKLSYRLVMLSAPWSIGLSPFNIPPIGIFMYWPVYNPKIHLSQRWQPQHSLKHKEVFAFVHDLAPKPDPTHCQNIWENLHIAGPFTNVVFRGFHPGVSWMWMPSVVWNHD